MIKRNLLLSLALLSALQTLAEEIPFGLSSPFSHHMVLQREQAIPVWGRSDPGDEVTVEFAGQRKTGVTNADRQWRVTLDPLKASAVGRELVVKLGNFPQHTFTNVVVGDVWLCSGQSNMAFRMAETANAQAEIAAASPPNVRFLTVSTYFDQQPRNGFHGVWRSVNPASAAECSAVAYYFGRALQPKVGVPIGLVISSVGGTRIETWMRAETLAATGLAGSLRDKWSKISPDEFQTIDTVYRDYQHQVYQMHPLAVKAAKAEGKPAPPAPPMPKLRCHDCPSALHNGMIAPLESIPFRGVIWYQGESNSQQPAAYEQLLPALIADWRRVWGAELPFLFVQLAPHRNTPPAFREAQHRIWQRTPNTAMVVTIDVGDVQNIHPTRKRPVGERLALAARALSYGEPIEYSGPLFDGLKIENDRAIVSFTHLGGGLMAKGDVLKGFTIAGAGGKFVPARAEIDGANVVVTADEVSNPVAVRYAWANAPQGNLFNSAGLPAAPFRSDSPRRLETE